MERKLTGDEPVALADDLLAIPVPGTPRAARAPLPGHVLFTGDHLMASEDDGLLHASRGVCWFSWPDQIRSMERLLDFRFEWVLPATAAVTGRRRWRP